MEDGGPSQTARRVAAHRLDFTRIPADYGDPAADYALAVDVAAGRQAPAGRMHDYLAARTTFFDRTVTGALGRGVTQVVVGAAGYDGRAFRYAKPGVRWFEVDHPATQRDKLERLGRLGIDASHVRFVEADFTRDPVAGRLRAAGLDPDVPSLFLLEGVAVYLEPDVLEDVLRQFRRVAAPAAAWPSACPCPGPAATPPASASRPRWPRWGSRPGPRSRPPRPKRSSPGPAGPSRPRTATAGRQPPGVTASAPPACWWPAPAPPHAARPHTARPHTARPHTAPPRPSRSGHRVQRHARRPAI